MITREKRVERLGTTCAIPVEVSAIGVKHTERRLQAVGCSTAVREQPGGTPYRTDGGNLIVDCRFTSVDDPEALDRHLQCIAGVLETGLFIGLCDTLIVGNDTGADLIEVEARTQIPRLKSPADP